MTERLYPNLLGDSWWSLDGAIRGFHGSDAEMLHASGVFQVHRGSHAPARALAWLARMPRAGDAVHLDLRVRARKNGEEWRRLFDERPLVSLQTREGPALVERVGCVEWRFRLEADGGSLRFHTISAALCLGSWRIPLPRLLSPVVTAHERAHAGDIDVSVDVAMPLVGRVIAYEGTLTRVEVQG